MKLLAAILLALLTVTATEAQTCNGQFVAGAVCGNSGSTKVPPSPSLLSPLLDRNFGAPTAQGSVLFRSSGAWTVLAPGTAGYPLLSQGSSADLAYGILPLGAGGTNAALVGSQGGIFYSTATAGAILAGTATANQMLQSGSSAAPAWSTATWPATTTINQLLYSSAANTVTGLATLASSVLVTDGSGLPSLSITLPNGIVATTQAAADNTTKVATDAFVQSVLTGGGTTKVANTVFAGPTSGAAAAPTFRALVLADLPGGSITSVSGTQVITASSYTVLATDTLVVLNRVATGTTTITLPTVASRIDTTGHALELDVCDFNGNSTTTNINANGADAGGINAVTTPPMLSMLSGGTPGTSGCTRLIPNVALAGWIAK